MTATKITEYTIDAAGRRLGRVAGDIARLLIGKNIITFARHTSPNVVVKVSNVSKLLIDDRKKKNTTYDRYSGYPDGRTVLSMQQVIDRKGYSELVRKAVYGMLPNNRLRAGRMKRLLVSE